MSLSYNLLDDGEKQRKLDHIYSLFFDGTTWNGKVIPPLYAPDLCLMFIRRNELQLEVDPLIDDVKEGRSGSLVTNRYMKLFCECFPELVRSRFEGFNRRRLPGNTFTWVFFPFDRAFSRYSELDGFEFNDADFKITENKELVSTMIVRSDDAQLDKDAVTASVEFNQLCDPIPTGTGAFVWHTEEPKKFEDEIGVCKTAVPGLNGTVDLRDAIPAPPSSYKKVDNHPVTYVYDYLMKQDAFIRTDLINTITANRWMRTVTDNQLKTCYSVFKDNRGFFKIRGRDQLAMKPIGAIKDVRLFSAIDDMNARAMRSGILHMWYFGLSITPEHKEVIENVKFIGKYCADRTDIAGIHHAVNFAATWTKSGLGKRPYVFTKAIFPKSSLVLNKTELDGACGGSVFMFTSKVSFNKRDNEVTRADILTDQLSQIVKKLKLNYRKFYIRVSLLFLEIDSTDSFNQLGVGFTLDVDPLSGWIWITNDETTYAHNVVKDSSNLERYEYAAGAGIRKTLCECLSGRFMVEQTHSSFGNSFKTISKWPKVIFKQDFENEEETTTLVSGGDLKKIDGLVAGPGAARSGNRNPFEVAAGVKPGASDPGSTQPQANPFSSAPAKPQINPFGGGNAPITSKSSSISNPSQQVNLKLATDDDNGFSIGSSPLVFNTTK